MDEFDLETAPLADATQDTTTRTAPLSQTQTDAPFAARLSRRRRVLRAGGILGVLLVALAILVAVTPGARSAVVGLVLGPTPTATVALDLGRDRFAVEDQVPWGTLTIDGRPGPPLVAGHLVSTPSGPQLPTFALARGRHQLAYRADPFPPLQCTLSVPAAPSDTCPLDPNAKQDPFAGGPLVRLLDLRATVDRLPASEAGQLTDAMQQALDRIAGGSHGTLKPGDHYLDADGHASIATEALTTVPVYTVQPQPINITGMSCTGLALCTLRSPTAQTSADEWLLYGQVLVSWRYRDASGRVVLADGLAAPAEFGSPSVTIQVGVRRVDRAWQVRLLPPIASNTEMQDLPLCDVAASYLDGLSVTLDPGTVNPTGASYQWPTSSWLADLGCVFGGDTTDSQGNLTGPVALVLYRCGILLVVNHAAQQVFPHLLVASAHEQALALAAWPPTPSSVGPGG